MMRLARKHSETGSRTVAGTMLILSFVHLERFKERIQSGFRVEANTGGLNT